MIICQLTISKSWSLTNRNLGYYFAAEPTIFLPAFASSEEAKKFQSGSRSRMIGRSLVIHINLRDVSGFVRLFFIWTKNQSRKFLK